MNATGISGMKSISPSQWYEVSGTRLICAFRMDVYEDESETATTTSSVSGPVAPTRAVHCARREPPLTALGHCCSLPLPHAACSARACMPSLMLCSLVLHYLLRRWRRNAVKAVNGASATSKKNASHSQASALAESDMRMQGDGDPEDALMNMLNTLSDGADVQVSLTPMGQLPVDVEGSGEHEHSSSGSSVLADDMESAPLFEAGVALPLPPGARGLLRHRRAGPQRVRAHDRCVHWRCARWIDIQIDLYH